MKQTLNKIFLTTFLIIIGFLIIYIFYNPKNQLRVIFLSVGQGDSILIITPDGQDILIDGGSDASVVSKIGKYLPPWDRTIEYMVITHPDADHIIGLVGVLKKYQVQEIIWRPFQGTTAVGRALTDLIEKENAQLVTADHGFDVDFNNNCLLHVFAPTPTAKSRGATTNDTSVVSRMNCEGKKILLTGDAPQQVENELVASEDVSADILKLGHHGSKNSSSYNFLRAVNPAYVVVSAGLNNPYNHPHPSVVALVKKMGMVLLSTQGKGDVGFRVSKGRVFVE